MTFRTRKEKFLAGTATPDGAAAQSDNPAAQPHNDPPTRSDDEDILVGWPCMARFASDEGYPVS
jgi:hypothetical protein